ncbi:MAG: Spo0E like sporulation regulatory protein [Clostridiales bacterium]|jgi:hypothetical protein|nr:Spo0E like sporulation regulatory protein [Clostridiales bacterium]MDK2932886.1 Spo0E like sporulation regulatory protein [Clostridiales bacterium]
MDNERENLKRNIETMQSQLNKLIEIEGPLSSKILELSKQLDRLILKYMKRSNV